MFYFSTVGMAGNINFAKTSKESIINVLSSHTSMCFYITSI